MGDAVEISRLRFTSLEMTSGGGSLEMADGGGSLEMTVGVGRSGYPDPGSIRSGFCQSQICPWVMPWRFLAQGRPIRCAQGRPIRLRSGQAHSMRSGQALSHLGRGGLLSIMHGVVDGWQISELTGSRIRCAIVGLAGPATALQYKDARGPRGVSGDHGALDSSLNLYKGPFADHPVPARGQNRSIDLK